KLVFFRRIVAKTDITEGERLTETNIACRRPWPGGIDASYYPLVLGRMIRKSVKVNDPITWDMV
ncbi:MAG: pseudaminic acid synthase, partial [Candidatus Wildermuthbacteria bacterium]|nr:pseudaminic acid synthase [Candidatus Wildermuthbacteria bacterium]